MTVRESQFRRGVPAHPQTQYENVIIGFYIYHLRYPPSVSVRQHILLNTTFTELNRYTPRVTQHNDMGPAV